jgi:glutathione reductase (NADPH)
LPQWPKAILIQGGGYIALEFAGIFAGLGSKVILVHRGDNVFHSEFDRPTEATSLTPGPTGYLLVNLR